MHAALADDGAVWVISEHGEVVGFDAEGKIHKRFQACSDRTAHTELQLSPAGDRIGVDCGEVYRVIDVRNQGSTPTRAVSAESVREVTLQTASARLTSDGLTIVGEEYIDGVTADTTAIHRFDRDLQRVEHLQGDYADTLLLGDALVALEETEEGFTLVRMEEPREPLGLTWSGDVPPTLWSQDEIVCLVGARGRCVSVDGTPVDWKPSWRPFVAPGLGVPACSPSGEHCVHVDVSRVYPKGSKPGIGRIEALAASADGTTFLTRDHRDQVVLHTPKGRRPITQTDGKIALSPSGRFAWYQTAQRSLRVELLNGVRTTLPRGTAAVFDDKDTLWMATSGPKNTTLITATPVKLDVAMPLFPLFDGKEITDLQIQTGNESFAPQLLMEFEQDDQYALLDLNTRSLGKAKQQKKAYVDHAYGPDTPVHLPKNGAPWTVQETDKGLELHGSQGTVVHTVAPGATLWLGEDSAYVIEGDTIDVRMGKSGRSATLPGPAHHVWVYDDRVYIALRDGRLAILR